VGVTAIVAGILCALDPTPWSDWVQFLFDHRDGTPDSRVSFILRCLAAAALIVVGSRKQWSFLIPPAMVLASPVLVSVVPWTILAALPRLLMAPQADVRPPKVR
jgi:hypothetical protein